jgi:hypothetical protein
MSEVYYLLSKLDKISEEDAPIMDNVMDIFAISSGYEERITNHRSYTIMTIMDNINSGVIRNALVNIGKVFDRAVFDVYSDWKQTISKMNSTDEFNLHDDNIAKCAEGAVNQVAARAETTYPSVESILSFLLIYNTDQPNLVAELDEALEHFIQRLEESMSKFSKLITQHLEGIIELRMNSIFQLPELDFKMI